MSRTVNFTTTDTVNEPFYACELNFSGSITREITTKVITTGDGTVFTVDGQQPDNYEITVALGNTIKFMQEDSSNTGHPLLLSTTADGTHGGGTEYTTGVTTPGTPGSAGGYTQWVVGGSLSHGDVLYFYCGNHAGMGGKINIVNSTIRLWTGFGNITIDSDTYYGSGDLGSISVVSESEQLKAQGITLGLSGIPNNMMSDALLQDYQGQNVNLYFGLLADGQLAVQPYLLFSGRMDVMSIVQEASTSIISVQCENYLVDLRRTKRGRYTTQDQQARYTGDLSLRFVEVIQADKEVLWGVPHNIVGKQIKTIDPDDINLDDYTGNYPW